MDFLWVVSKEIWFFASRGYILRVWVVLAVLSEEMAHDDSWCDPDNEDLEHKPEIEVWCSCHAFIFLSLEINELHEHENSKLENREPTNQIAIEQLCLKPTNINQCDKDIHGVKYNIAPQHQPDSTTIRNIPIENIVGAIYKANRKEQCGHIEDIPEWLIGISEFDESRSKLHFINDALFHAVIRTTPVEKWLVNLFIVLIIHIFWIRIIKWKYINTYLLNICFELFYFFYYI